MEADFVHHDYKDLAEGMTTLFKDIDELIDVKELKLNKKQKDLIMEMITLLIYTDYTVFYTPYLIEKCEDVQ